MSSTVPWKTFWIGSGDHGMVPKLFVATHYPHPLFMDYFVEHTNRFFSVGPIAT